jgi:hypothetical protein
MPCNLQGSQRQDSIYLGSKITQGSEWPVVYSRTKLLCIEDEMWSSNQGKKSVQRMDLNRIQQIPATHETVKTISASGLWV